MAPSQRSAVTAPWLNSNHQTMDLVAWAGLAIEHLAEPGGSTLEAIALELERNWTDLPVSRDHLRYAVEEKSYTITKVGDRYRVQD